ncbi:serine/threonine-protein kinase [Spatholobus suberectus]|nr:serine/threonine-protein kinase [Spatholobus suberectus]
MDVVLEVLRRIESGKDEPEVHSEGPLSPTSLDHDEVKLLRNMKLIPSPKAVTDKWYSKSTSPNITSVAELAFQCLQRDKELRPSMDEVLETLWRIGSPKDEPTHLEEVNVHDEGPLSPPSPDHDEVKLLRNMKLIPSPKAVTDKRDSESTSLNVSGQSPTKSKMPLCNLSQVCI